MLNNILHIMNMSRQIRMDKPLRPSIIAFMEQAVICVETKSVFCPNFLRFYCMENHRYRIYRTPAYWRLDTVRHKILHPLRTTHKYVAFPPSAWWSLDQWYFPINMYVFHENNSLTQGNIAIRYPLMFIKRVWRFASIPRTLQSRRERYHPSA